MKQCAYCNKSLSHYQVKYCSIRCQKEKEYQNYIAAWKNGQQNGKRGVSAQNISRHIVRYLFEKYSNKCSICSWSITHPLTGLPPLEIDHIDGNADNNQERNLRLLCPNCHALTSTHRNHNKGNGRLWRRQKYGKIVEMPL